MKNIYIIFFSLIHLYGSRTICNEGIFPFCEIADLQGLHEFELAGKDSVCEQGDSILPIKEKPFCTASQFKSLYEN